MYADTAVDFDRFAHRVVPLLVERGLFAPAPAGVTLRERLGLAHPHRQRTDEASSTGRTPAGRSPLLHQHCVKGPDAAARAFVVPGPP